MADNITINIPQGGNKRIQIQVDFIAKKSNNIYEFKINSITPINAEIPPIAENFSESLSISDPINQQFSYWGIHRNGDNLILKVYPNPTKMTLDSQFSK